MNSDTVGNVNFDGYGHGIDADAFGAIDVDEHGGQNLVLYISLFFRQFRL
jgi:hypothetical protein